MSTLPGCVRCLRQRPLQAAAPQQTIRHHCASCQHDTQERQRAGCRAVLGRGPDGMLSDGSDGKRLRTRVQFLAGHEGQYRLGSVAFSADGADTSSSSPQTEDEHPPAEQPADTGVAMHDAVVSSDAPARPAGGDVGICGVINARLPCADVRLALDAVLASARGQSLLATEVSVP